LQNHVKKEKIEGTLSHGCNLQQGCTNRHLGQNLAHGNTETIQKTFKVATCIHILEAVKSCYILIILGSEKILHTPITKTMHMLFCLLIDPGLTVKKIDGGKMQEAENGPGFDITQ